MDDRQMVKLGLDKRLLKSCIYCGGSPDTRDHVPSKVFLDKPYPDNLPVVACCLECNRSFSLDEEYVACFLECVIAGSTSPDAIQREGISRKLSKNLKLASRIALAQKRSSDGQLTWYPEMDRVNNVTLMLACGHVAYEFSLPHLHDPISINSWPLINLDDQAVERFFNPDEPLFQPWPGEIGSR